MQCAPLTNAAARYTIFTIRSNVEFWKYAWIKLCFRRELRSLRSLPSLLCKLAVYAAVELLEQASASLTLETARSRNLAFAHFYSFFKTRHSGITRNWWKISSFKKLEIEPFNNFSQRIMCFPPARKCAFRHSSPVLVLTYPVVKLVDGHVLVIVIFYSCGGFNTPTLAS